MDVTMYWYAKCGTCRDAYKWLLANGNTVRTIELFASPPSVQELQELLEKSSLPVQKFFNVSGEVYKALNLKDQMGTMTQEAKLDLLAANGRLIKRPIVTDGNRVTVGFKADDYAKVWA
jgi:arsenate reductase